jgi:hypothetical protein
MQSVPRVVSYSPELEILLITPIAELAQLRTGLLHASASPLALGPNATTVRGAAGATLDIAVNFTCPPAAPARSVGLAAAASSEHLGTPAHDGAQRHQPGAWRYRRSETGAGATAWWQMLRGAAGASVVR